MYLGIRKGDIIVCALPNLYQSLVIFKAANSIGAIVTFINQRSTSHQISKYVDLYKSKILFVFNKSSDYVKEINNCSIKYIVNISEKKVDSRIYNKNLCDINSSRFIDFHSLPSLGGLWKSRAFDRFRHFNAKDDALILYTSGSTGEPKNILFTNENIISSLVYLKASTHTKPYQKNNF